MEKALLNVSPENSKIRGYWTNLFNDKDVP